MIVLFILGAFGVKAAVAVYIVYRLAKWTTEKGEAIKQGYENEIAKLKRQNKRLKPAYSFTQSKGARC